MLQLIIPDSDELWDEKKEEFVYRKGQMGIKMVFSISFKKGQDP